MKKILNFKNENDFNNAWENSEYPSVALNNETIYVKENIDLINFTLDGYGTFQAVKGMTWREWAESEYNVNNYFIDVVYHILVVEDGDAGGWNCSYRKFIVDGECHESNYTTFPMYGVDLDFQIQEKTYNICEWVEGIGCGGGVA